MTVHADGLRARSWGRFIKGPDPQLLEELYVPALAVGVRYDRCCAYFSSTVLAAAARGFAKLIERLDAMGSKAPRPAIRLLVNEELAADDVRALTEGGHAGRLEEVLKRRFKTPKDALERQRLAMLGWLVKSGLLAVRVGVMRQGGGIMHAKFGIIIDAGGDRLTFSGSGNESAQGLVANYERLEVSGSWADPDRDQEYRSEFEALWTDAHPDVHSLPLPEALRLKLIKLAPKTPPTVEPTGAASRQKAAMRLRFLLEAPYLPDGAGACDASAFVELWAHQQGVVDEVTGAWPDGRLLCDEVGMGKTIEAILALRRLVAGRGVKRALILVPAGLTRQWQEELREKGGIEVPRLEGSNLLWPDGRNQKLGSFEEGLRQDLLLLSRETARMPSYLAALVAAPPWDLVILDEAHAARRRSQEEGEFNSGTLLLDLLRTLQLRGRARSLMLLSATPMQTHPWEPWDLLSVLGEGGAWMADFAAVRDYYDAIDSVQRGRADQKLTLPAARLIVADGEYPQPTEWLGKPAEAIAKAIAFAPPSKRKGVAAALRAGSPLARRMHRNTRETLRAYHALGRLDAPPPERRVEDLQFEYGLPGEREVYEAIKKYVDTRFDQLEQEKPGKGFVMTIYRRRAVSSPFALDQSLRRRLEGLNRVIRRQATDAWVVDSDSPERLDADDVGDFDGGKISAALPQNPTVARQEATDVGELLHKLEALGTTDSKRERFFEVLRQLTDDGRPVLVFSEYSDTVAYLRDSLAPLYDLGVGCYTGSGGQVWLGGTWKSVSKAEITHLLRTGKLRVLLCTDAASEGLNLQAAGALINYDLPWNPSRVEQRIGRIDRIGQAFPSVRIVNLFLKDSVDEKVYQVLQERCGLFTHFVGPMQPVLAQARRMLTGADPVDLQALRDGAVAIAADALANLTYLQAEALQVASTPPAASNAQLLAVLRGLDGTFGPRSVVSKDGARVTVTGGTTGKTVFACSGEALEADPKLSPLSPLDERLMQLAGGLWRAGERLPLVVASHQVGAFRGSVALWVGLKHVEKVGAFAQVDALIAGWDGAAIAPEAWQKAHARALREAKTLVTTMAASAAERERKALERQIEAARLRLLKELLRFLLCMDVEAADLGQLIYQELKRGTGAARRIRHAQQLLGEDYPAWDAWLVAAERAFVQGLTQSQREGRLLGKELDAALGDPRWAAAETLRELS